MHAFDTSHGTFIKSQDARLRPGDKTKMKKTVPSKRKTTKKSTNPGFEIDAIKILRTLKDDEAFYFYEAVGKSTGEVAKNLTDFLDKLKSVKSESLTFHIRRGDFQNWVEKTLGDAELAGRLRKISSSDDDETRTRLYKAVENRLKELRELSLPVLVDQTSTILVSSSR